MPKITIIKDSKEYVFEAKEGQSILEAGLEHGVEIEHACGGYGFCTTCMCRVKEHPENLGEITPQELNMGIPEGSTDTRLSCQSIIKGDVKVQTEY